MDDHPIWVAAQRCVIRQCEVSRHQGQLLARAYQQVFPQVRRPLFQETAAAPAAKRLSSHPDAAAVAAGA